MASGSGATVTVNVQANTQNAQQQLGYLRTMMRQFGTEVTNRFASIFSAVAVVKMGFDKVSEAMDKNMQVAKQISSLSTKFHIDPKEVHSLLMSAEQAGVSVRSLLMGMKSLGQAASKAVVNKDFQNAFKQMGMDAKNLGDMASKPAKSFAEVAVKLSEIASETIRAEVGTKLLGRSYQQLQPLIDKLADSEEEREKLLNNPNAMDKDKVSAAKEQQKAQANMKESFESMVQSLIPMATLAVSFLGLIVDGIRLIVAYVKYKMSSNSSLDQQGEQAGYITKEDIGEKMEGLKGKSGLKNIETVVTDAYGKPLLDENGQKIKQKSDYEDSDEFAFQMLQKNQLGHTSVSPLTGKMGHHDAENDPLSAAANKAFGYINVREETKQGEMRAGDATTDTGVARRRLLAEGLRKYKDKEGKLDLRTLISQTKDASQREALQAFQDIYNKGVKTKNGKPSFDVEASTDYAGKVVADEDKRKEDAYKEEKKQIGDSSEEHMYRIKNTTMPKGQKWTKGANGVWFVKDDNFTLGTDEEKLQMPVDYAQVERQKKAKEKLDKRSRLTQRGLLIAEKGGRDEEVERAEISLGSAGIEVTSASEKNDSKQEEKQSAAEALVKAQKAEKEAREAYLKDKNTPGQASMHDVEIKNKLRDAINEVVNAQRALDKADNDAQQSADGVTEALTKQKEAENALKKAKDARVAKDMHDTTEALKHDESLEKKAFDRRMKDAKLQGKTQQEVGEETLEFEKQRLEEQARLYEFAKSEAERRKAENGGELQKADEDELKRQQAAFEQAQDRVHEAIYALAQNDTGQATDMRKMGGGGAVFGGASNVGMTAVEANRRKIPLLEKIEKNTRPDTGGINGGTPVDDFPKYGDNNYAQT
jgi:hypothetical protein